MTARPMNPNFANREHLGLPWARHWVRFERDMKELGFDVHECAGPNGWGGPAVTAPRERLTEIRRATRVRLDTHDVEDGHVMVYPKPIET